MNIQQLIEKGEELRNESYESPLVDLWQNDLKAAIAEYGEEMLKILDKSFHFGFVVTTDSQAQQMHNEMITKVQTLLKDLEKRNKSDSVAQSAIINQKRAEAKATLGTKFNKAVFNVTGPATFGDNSPVNNVQVGELLLAIMNEAEESLEDGDEKDKLLDSLKSVIANPTFAALAGASLPEILKRLLS